MFVGVFYYLYLCSVVMSIPSHGIDISSFEIDVPKFGIEILEGSIYLAYHWLQMFNLFNKKFI